MPKKKEEEVLDVMVDTAEEVVETPIKSTKEKSEEYVKFLTMIQAYKQQNPTKYKQKEAAFLAKLETL